MVNLVRLLNAALIEETISLVAVRELHSLPDIEVVDNHPKSSRMKIDFLIQGLNQVLLAPHEGRLKDANVRLGVIVGLLRNAERLFFRFLSLEGSLVQAHFLVLIHREPEAMSLLAVEQDQVLGDSKDWMMLQF